jgi:DNA-binding Lrp family transcriptional regulator
MRPDEIDDRDRAILRALMSDGLLTNLELAEQVHLSRVQSTLALRTVKKTTALPM